MTKEIQEKIEAKKAVQQAHQGRVGILSFPPDLGIDPRLEQVSRPDERLTGRNSCGANVL